MDEFKDDELNEQQKAEKEAKRIYEANRDLVLGLVKEGKLPEPRKLTRAERRKLDAAKVNIFKIEPTDPRSYHAVKDDLADWIIENIYPKFKGFDDLDASICTFFGEYVFGISYRNDLTAKN